MDFFYEDHDDAPSVRAGAVKNTIYALITAAAISLLAATLWLPVGTVPIQET